MKLDQSQEDAITRVHERLKAGVNRQLIVAATGWGKTPTMAGIPSRLGMRKRTMVLTHRESLAQQTAKTFQEWNPQAMVGIEMGSQQAGGLCDIVIGSVPTLGKRNGRINKFHPDDFEFVAPDEAHHSTSPEWRRCLVHFGVDVPRRSHILSVGFTATPNRSDGSALANNFDEIVYEYPILKGIQDGILVDLHGVRIDTEASLDGVKWSNGQFNDAELTSAINTDERNGLVVKSWLDHCAGEKTLVFTQNIQHAVDLAAAFQAFGIRAEAVWGEDPDNKKKIAAHKAGEFDVMLNARYTIEGYDDPTIKWVLLATPDSSALVYQQKVGRVTRIEKEVRRRFGNIHEAIKAGFPVAKTWGGVMDFCDTCRKHSLQTLPSLLGMPKDLDLRGKSVTKAKEQVDRVARDFPMANLQEIKSLDEINKIAENIALFHVSYPPEIASISDLAWRKAGDGYILSVNRELLTISKDLRDEYWVRGTLQGRQVSFNAQNLSGAFNAADRAVLESGGIKAVLQREAKWRDAKPSDKQVALCRKLGISIPKDANKGQVSAALDARLNRAMKSNEYQGAF